MIHRFKNILSYNDFILLNEEFNARHNSWNFLKKDEDIDEQPYMGCLDKPLSHSDTLGDNLTLIKYGSLLKYVCQIKLKRSLTLVRVNTNIQFFGQESSFHKDKYQPGSWTLILFMSYKWRTEWGGEFVVCDEEGNYNYQAYIPNDAILIPAHLDHMGFAPNIMCRVPRLSVAYTYS